MKYTIRGDDLQVVDIQLELGESMVSEAGGMAWKSPSVRMDTQMPGGLFGGLARSFAGESLMLSYYHCEEAAGLVAFASELPGKIVPMALAAGEAIIAQKDAFMCAEASVELSVHWQRRLGAGIFGGEGFILEKVTGPGTTFFELAGEITPYTLAAGQKLQVAPGHVAMFDPSVDFDIELIKGLKNIFFGGQGFFLATLTGPGRIWLQSMPIANLAARLMPYLPQRG